MAERGRVHRAYQNGTRSEFTSWTTGTPWDFQYNELSFYIVPETYFFLPTFRSSFRQTARPVELAPGFLDLEPAGAPRLVRQGGDGQLPAQRDPARRPAGRRALQRPDLALPDREGSKGLRPAGLRAKRRAGGHAVVPQPRLRQRRRHQRAPRSPATRASSSTAGRRIHADLQKHYDALPRGGTEGQQRRAAARHADRGHPGARPGRRIPQAAAWSWPHARPTQRARRAGADGGEPGARALGAGAQPSGKPCSRCG